MQLIRALLKAEVDLLWFGGIGTYVKASDESQVDVGDRANDALRVDARELRCKVVGEGANLGLTQRGRIEYALAGRQLNTDAIDNSAGVDCSDHEVNIKILLNDLVAAGDMTRQAAQQAARRDDRRGRPAGAARQLSADPGALRGRARAPVAHRPACPLHARHGADGRLDRAVEFLPDDETIARAAPASATA